MGKYKLKDFLKFAVPMCLIQILFLAIDALIALNGRPAETSPPVFQPFTLRQSLKKSRRSSSTVPIPATLNFSVSIVNAVSSSTVILPSSFFAGAC